MRVQGGPSSRLLACLARHVLARTRPQSRPHAAYRQHPVRLQPSNPQERSCEPGGLVQRVLCIARPIQAEPQRRLMLGRAIHRTLFILTSRPGPGSSAPSWEASIRSLGAARFLADNPLPCRLRRSDTTGAPGPFSTDGHSDEHGFTRGPRASDPGASLPREPQPAAINASIRASSGAG